MPKTKSAIPDPMFDVAARIMRAISHPLRLRILEVLEKRKEANVTALCEACSASQPMVSQQLSRLRHAGVLDTRRDGSSVIYHVARPEVLGVLECIRRMGGQR